jgi:TonB family protein
MGAILYLLVTGEEPPDSLTASAFMQAVRSAKTMSGQEMPPEIRAILEKSLHIDPAMRYPSMAEMKQALSALAHGGKYSATTFNLAFYLSNLLKKEMEAEAIDREKESKVNAAAYAEHPPSAPMPAIAAPTFGVSAGDEPKKRNMVPLYAAAAIVVIGGGITAAMMMRGGTKAAPAPTSTAPPPVKAAVAAPAPVVVSQPVMAATSTTATADPDAQKKAFEQAVAQKMQEELMKLQKEYTQQLKQQQSKNAPVPVPAPPAAQPQRPQPADERSAPSAAALDERRLEQRQTATQPPAPQPSAPQQVAQSTPQPQPAAAAPVHTVREGDVVEWDVLDSPLQTLTQPRPIFPPMALRAKATANILLSALVDENGRVIDVKVLRGDPRFGFNDEAMRAMRGARFSPPVKDGKRVKTWRPQTISFSQ